MTKKTQQYINFMRRLILRMLEVQKQQFERVVKVTYYIPQQAPQVFDSSSIHKDLFLYH